MEKMFYKFAKTCEISKKIQSVENESTRRYLGDLVEMCVRFGADLECVDIFVDSYIEKNIIVSELLEKQIHFYKNEFDVINNELFSRMEGGFKQ